MKMVMQKKAQKKAGGPKKPGRQDPTKSEPIILDKTDEQIEKERFHAIGGHFSLAVSGTKRFSYQYEAKTVKLVAGALRQAEEREGEHVRAGEVDYAFLKLMRDNPTWRECAADITPWF